MINPYTQALLAIEADLTVEREKYLLVRKQKKVLSLYKNVGDLQSKIADFQSLTVTNNFVATF